MAIAASYNEGHEHSTKSGRVVLMDGSSRSSLRRVQPLDMAIDGCDACPHCADVCTNENCMSCRDKKSWTCGQVNACGKEQTFTLCEIKRHRSPESAWLVAGGYVYDATSYIASHPGGKMSILKKCGGICDCTQDLLFHSKEGQKVWSKYIIGKVKPCCPQGEKVWWKFW